MGENILLEWRAPEYRKSPKSADWFFGIGLIALALAIWAIYTINIMFLLTVLVGFVVLLIFALRKPKIYTFKITSAGIFIGKTLVPFQSIESFWVFDFPDAKILSLKPKSRLSPGTHIIVPEAKISDLKSILSEYLPEVEENYSFVDWLADYLRF
ncbi:MAG: hypothetical protein ACK4NX_01915 [Candidatus Paceibacteria bacterium]